MFSKNRLMKLSGVLNEQQEYDVPVFNSIPPVDEQDKNYDKIYDAGWIDYKKGLNPKYIKNKNNILIHTVDLKPVSYGVKDVAIAYINGYVDAYKYYKAI